MKIQKVFFRKPKGSLSHYLRWRIASSSEGAIFGPGPTSDSDSLPKLCPIGLDQTSKVKGTNLDKFLNIFQLKFVCYLSTSFAIFVLEIKTWSGMFTCIKYLTLSKVYSRPKLGNNWTAFKKDIMWCLQKQQGKYSIYWTVYRCKWSWPFTSWVQWKRCAERWSSFSLPFSCIQIWSRSTLHHKAREAPSLLCCIHCEFLDTQMSIHLF